VPVTEVASLWKDKKISSFIKTRNDCIMDKRKGGAYYGICCGDFLSYKASLTELKNIKKSIPGAFPRKFDTTEAEKLEMENNRSAIHHVKKRTVIKKQVRIQKKRETAKSAPKEDVKPVYEERNIFNDFFARNIINAKTDSDYEMFSLQKYLKKLLDTSKNLRIQELDSKILLLL
jgi:hypothetical protein